jgi:hypothetical protein
MSSEGAEFRLPLEFPTAEYDEQYMQRLINPTEVEDDLSANAWFMS